MNDRSPEHIRPLLVRIDRLMAERERVLVAIDGGSASGKTTLGALLQNVYGCPVFHMDDFFLRPEQRTPERFSEPGGNVDRERFLSEVLLPLREGKTVDYRCFDCKTFTIASPRRIEPGRLNIIEGAYAMHPDLAPYYDLTVFLAVSAEKQRERILKRNAPAQAELFFDRWIPFEQRYFAALNVPERCDLTIILDDQTSVPSGAMPSMYSPPMATSTTSSEMMKPCSIGFAPDLHRSAKLVLRPMAASAATIRNLLMLLSVAARGAGMTPREHKIDIARKPRINHGKTDFMLTLTPWLPLCAASFCFRRMLMAAKTSTVGMMASVRVSLTIVAKSPAASLKA